MMFFATKDEMISNLADLRLSKMKLDRFFTMYLDKFERKMDPEKTNTPVWDLYKQKMKEYDGIERQIKTLEYRISQV